ncbi:hypothetical protein Syn8016DRAFT_0551 [Synechococcus sp. WH 8016]|jgi:hypothetical protein|nr:hypothetical protein Syn8016DRAFT_0551 [Synechococcus sp. WH 8016]
MFPIGLIQSGLRYKGVLGSGGDQLLEETGKVW